MAYKRGDTWTATWTEDSRRKTKGGFPTKSMAEELEQKKRREETRIREGLATRTEVVEAERSRRSIRETIKQLDAHLAARVKLGEIREPHRKETVRATRVAADRIGAVVVSQLTDRAIADLRAELIEEDLSSWSIRRYCQCLVELRRFTLEGPRQRMRRTKPRVVSRALTPAEFARLIVEPESARVAAARRRDLYTFLAWTGFRWREACRLRWCDVDLERGTVSIGESQSKTGRKATVAIAAPVIEALADRLRASPAVGEVPIFPPVAYREWRVDLKRARIRHRDESGEVANRKCLRKTFTTWCAEAGVDRDTRLRLRRDVGGIDEDLYTARGRPSLIKQQRRALDRLVKWYEGSLRQKSA